MDLLGAMRVKSINGKRYVLVIVDDYSRYTWVHFLRSKDEAPEEIKTFLKKITVLLQAPVIIQLLLHATLKTAPSFTVDLTKHHTSSLTVENQISPIYMYSELFVPKNDHDDIGKLGAKAMAFEQHNLKLGLQSMTSGKISLGLDLIYAPSTITSQKLPERELDLLFEAIYDDYIGGQPSSATRTALVAQAPQVLQTPTASTTIANTSPTLKNSSSQAADIPNTSHDVDDLKPEQQHV
ncbi:retrovirus-related pol polyprotein from transposon TNT 1-94 [Tanacetum coccineum]|uniref:Retrovirus-related pol polyprotein from transposon TNT 1-94 n=1 Tax=Tanacetum coccineum TaxID=301880 RepID=A0ABQ4XQI5_9ASTR